MNTNKPNDNDMKYFYLPITNFIAIFMLFIYVMITKDINTRALDEVEKLEQQVANQEKMINFLVTADKNVSRKDTIVINMDMKYKK